MKLHDIARRLAPASLFLGLAATARAHPGHDGGHDLTWDFAGGALHPLGGLDHLLAMIAIGVWAMQLGRAARWAVPAAFVAAMTAGAFLGAGGTTFSWMEQAIGASVLVLGLLVMTATRVPVLAGMAIAAAFALFHGVAHGAAMPRGADGLSYGLGFVMTTTVLHVAGLSLGSLSAKLPESAHRIAGAALMVAGGWLLAA